LLSCLSFDDAKVRLFANTGNILIRKSKKKWHSLTRVKL
jgi:hypothetical protein